mmetsp:Transcript_120139/g.275229  ORF Transcript_120139/g.275229 Transcript_120139/m.275229 type:complete len:145 (-) Transcript_120139:19-453(-)
MRLERGLETQVFDSLVSIDDLVELGDLSPQHPSGLVPRGDAWCFCIAGIFFTVHFPDLVMNPSWAGGLSILSTGGFWMFRFVEAKAQLAGAVPGHRKVGQPFSFVPGQVRPRRDCWAVWRVGSWHRGWESVSCSAFGGEATWLP